MIWLSGELLGDVLEEMGKYEGDPGLDGLWKLDAGKAIREGGVSLPLVFVTAIVASASDMEDEVELVELGVEAGELVEEDEEDSFNTAT